MSRWKSPALPGPQKQKTTNNLRIKYKEKYKEKQVIHEFAMQIRGWPVLVHEIVRHY